METQSRKVSLGNADVIIQTDASLVEGCSDVIEILSIRLIDIYFDPI